MRPVLSEEARLMELFNAAHDLALEQIKDKTVSSQVLAKVLGERADYNKRQLELQKLEAETRLAEARVEAIKESQTSSALFAGVIKAMSRYRGQEIPTDAEIAEMVPNEIVY